MEKNGMLSEKSHSDFDKTKKAEYYDEEGFAVADKDNRHRLKTPVPLKNLEKEDNE